MLLIPWKLRRLQRDARRGGRKVPSSLWEEGQKMWMLNVGRGSSREGHAKGRGLCQLLERRPRLLLHKTGR